MHSAIDELLTLDPDRRPGMKEVENMPLFGSVQWQEVLKQQAPFVPEPTSSTDTTYFEGNFCKIMLDLKF
jgi:hypothetical protein